MLKSPFDPCIPTRGITVPAGPDWIHEIKHDGYRLIVQRDGDRVRLGTRNGHDWSDRYPWIVEAALKLRQERFVLDGEAVLLKADGRSDFNTLHSRRLPRGTPTLPTAPHQVPAVTPLEPGAHGWRPRSNCRRRPRPQSAMKDLQQSAFLRLTVGEALRAHCSSSDTGATFAAVIRDPGATQKPC
jgi:hypothetical protein